MSTEKQHTPLPWRLQRYSNYEGFSIWGDGYCIAERWNPSAIEREHLEANAEIIVRAVNSFEQMLEALEAAKLSLSQCIETAEKDGARVAMLNYDTAKMLDFSIRAAIRAAKGGAE